MPCGNRWRQTVELRLNGLEGGQRFVDPRRQHQVPGSREAALDVVQQSGHLRVAEGKSGVATTF
jgi:hypothetical protein